MAQPSPAKSPHEQSFSSLLLPMIAHKHTLSSKSFSEKGRQAQSMCTKYKGKRQAAFHESEKNVHKRASPRLLSLRAAKR